jgi:hypothetical protein
VNTWIPTFHDHAYPLMVRTYLRPLRDRLGAVSYRERFVMVRYARGEPVVEEAPAIFARGLDLYDVQVVCIRSSEHASLQREILRASGFRPSVQRIRYELWERSGQGGSPDASAIESR